MEVVAEPEAFPVELDHRASAGVEVSLLWQPVSGALSVLVVDTRWDGSFEVEVAPERALDAFRHPFAYAARGGVQYRVAA